MIECYQDIRRRPRRRFSNLTRLARPTQMYAISVKGMPVDTMTVIVTHRPDAPNGEARAFALESLAELGDFAETADRLIGTDRIEMEKRLDFPLVTPEYRPAENACVTMANQIRPPRMASQERFVGAQMNGQMLLQSAPPGAYWWIRHRGKLPEARAFLAQVGEKRKPRGYAAQAVAESVPAPINVEPAPVYGAFSDPRLWIGDPPFRTARERILDTPSFVRQEGIFMSGGAVAGVPTYVYSNGLVLAASTNQVKARWVINQVFAALSRSGVPSFTVSDEELVTVSRFDPWKAKISGSSSAVVPRNKQLGILRDAVPTDIVLVMPGTVVPAILHCADECSRHTRLAILSLRRLDAFTLFHRRWFSETFVLSWSLIEAAIDDQFQQFWRGRDASKKKIDEMLNDWTASQKIDLLSATDVVDADTWRTLHTLRKVRNDIVHSLREATESEASECLRAAEQLNPVPAVADMPKPRYAQF